MTSATPQRFKQELLPLPNRLPQQGRRTQNRMQQIEAPASKQPPTIGAQSGKGMVASTENCGPGQEEASGTAQEQKVEDNTEQGQELRTGLGAEQLGTAAAASPVQLDDEADAPAKTSTGPNPALLPFINASKAAAKRQRVLEKGSVIGKDTAFLKVGLWVMLAFSR